MKIFSMAAVVCMLLFQSFIPSADDKLNSAEAEQVQGVYVFYKCKPVRSYDYLGTVSTPFVIKNYKGSYLVDLMVKRAKEKHSTCNAVIFKNEDLTEVDAITIK